nr:hypothetical protein CFP56_34826 [Quercus suber]
MLNCRDQPQSNQRIELHVHIHRMGSGVEDAGTVSPRHSSDPSILLYHPRSKRTEHDFKRQFIDRYRTCHRTALSIRDHRPRGRLQRIILSQHSGPPRARNCCACRSHHAHVSTLGRNRHQQGSNACKLPEAADPLKSPPGLLLYRTELRPEVCSAGVNPCKEFWGWTGWVRRQVPGSRGLGTPCCCMIRTDQTLRISEKVIPRLQHCDLLANVVHMYTIPWRM